MQALVVPKTAIAQESLVAESEESQETGLGEPCSNATVLINELGESEIICNDELFEEEEEEEEDLCWEESNEDGYSSGYCEGVTWNVNPEGVRSESTFDEFTGCRVEVRSDGSSTSWQLSKIKRFYQ